MAKRVMVLVDLDKRRKFTSTNVLCTVAAFGKRAARRQVRDVGWQARDLVKFLALLVCGVGYAF